MLNSEFVQVPVVCIRIFINFVCYTKKTDMWRKIRIVLATVFFIGITLLFLDFSGVIHQWLGWMAKIQALPALLALNVGIVVGLIVLTLLFGRLYCSIICPLGVFQDIFNHFGSKGKKRRARFSFKKENKWLRYPILVIFVVLMVAGLNSIAIIIAPYSAYGRIASNLFAPIYQGVNNFLAFCAERYDSYAFYTKDVWIKSIPTFIIAIVTFIVVGLLSYKGGRTWCNNICPVGTILGFFSRFAAFRPVINVDKCNGCTLCAKKCKASCINPAEHSIDYSRCVMCMDCFENCAQKAYEWKFMWGKERIENHCESHDNKRRQFLATAGALTLAATVKAQGKKVDGGLAKIVDKKVPHRDTPVIPAGAASVKHFAQHCTGCQLCVQSCPNDVLRPSNKFDTFLQPEMSFEKGYCRPECNECSTVCPAGAIRPITIEDKSATHIGHAVWIRNNCIVISHQDSCAHCARHCPTSAITMVPLTNDAGEAMVSKRTGVALTIPTVNEEKCIGCGKCENLCPAAPFSAIYVEGHLIHSVK